MNNISIKAPRKPLLERTEKARSLCPEKSDSTRSSLLVDPTLKPQDFERSVCYGYCREIESAAVTVMDRVVDELATGLATRLQR